MTKRLRSLALLTFVGGCTFAAFAAPVTYHVTLNTSARSGSTGSLDFNFNPGPLSTQAASVQVLNFTSDGTPSGSSSTTGHAGGTMPGTLTLDNGTPYNDFFDPFVYGSSLSFDISLFGAALSTPNGTSKSGSTFVFSLFSDAGGTVPAFTTDNVNGFGYVANVNLDGSTTVTNYLTSSSLPTGITPEPSSLVLVTSAAGVGIARLLERRRRLC